MALRSRLCLGFPLSLSFSSKSQRKGPEIPAPSGEGLAALCRDAAHRAKRDRDTLPPVLPLGALHTLLDHPAAPTFESFSNLGSAPRLRPLNATAFRSFTLAFSDLLDRCQVPTNTEGLSGSQVK